MGERMRRSQAGFRSFFRARAVLPAALVGLCWLPACNRAAEPAEPAGTKPRIVVTHSILADITANIAGDRWEIVSLVGPDGDAHTYEPTPADLRSMGGAKLVVETGFGFEPWLDKLYQSSGSKAGRVVASQGIKPRTLIEEGRQEIDPHCWQDVRGAMQIARNIADALAKADPQGAATYQSNLQGYLAKLEELDGYIVQRVESLPGDRRILLTSHDSLGYFAARYGFKQLGSALASLTTEAGDPSALKIKTVIEEIRRSKVPAIFTENMHSPKLMEQIGKEAGIRVDTTLYTDALGAKGSPGETYFKMMRYNVDRIVGLLKP
jgi:zinc/manganese transport system substrate-binding protein